VDLAVEAPEVHGHRRADGVPADRDGEPQLDDAPAHHRFDPQRSGVDERQLHEAAEERAVRPVFYQIATNGGNFGHYKAAPTREKADQLLSQRLAAPFSADANDLLYAWDSSRDYNPSAGLERIEATLLAINAADDERNPWSSAPWTAR
jgi:homoserine O-acetyltransferase